MIQEETFGSFVITMVIIMTLIVVTAVVLIKMTNSKKRTEDINQKEGSKLTKNISKKTKRTLIAFVVFILVIFLGNYHIVLDATDLSRGSVFIKRPYFGFSDIIGSTNNCTNAPYYSVMLNHPSLCKALQNAGYLESEEAREKRIEQEVEDIIYGATESVNDDLYSEYLFQEARNATRYSHLSSIANATYSYAIDNNINFPPGCPAAYKNNTTWTEVTEENCSDLTPIHIQELPIDPQGGAYRIRFDKDNRIVVTASSTASDSDLPTITQ